LTNTNVWYHVRMITGKTMHISRKAKAADMNSSQTLNLGTQKKGFLSHIQAVIKNKETLQIKYKCILSNP
jgi:hypothetical protein